MKKPKSLEFGSTNTRPAATTSFQFSVFNSHVAMRSLACATILVAAPLLASDACCRTLLKADGSVSSSVHLTTNQVATIGLTTDTASERDLELTHPALGKLEALTERQAVLSTRIAGRVVKLNARLGQTVKRGEVLAEIESRQPGDPPPVIQLTSPADGIVGRIDVRLGEPVGPEKPLLEINDFTTLDAVAHVFQARAGLLKIGMKARVRVPACPEHEFYEGTLVRFGTQADGGSRTLDAVFRIQDHDGHLRPGLQARFDILLQETTRTFSVPRAAIFREGGTTHCYVADPDFPLHFTRTPVRLLEKGNDEFVAIAAEGPGSLLPGDLVVTKGHDLLPYIGNSAALMAAMDAAHGHSHGPGERAHDGEAPHSHADETNAAPAAARAHDDHGHSHGGATAGASGGFATWLTVTLGAAAGGFALLSFILSWQRRGAVSASTKTVATSTDHA